MTASISTSSCLIATMVDYTLRRTPSLIQLTNTRGLHVNSYKGGPRTRQDYINALRSADNNPKTLCGLPPELRLIIFQHLLLFNFEKPGVSTNVLRTCRHFYDEAMPVLYDENPVSINIAVRDFNNDEHNVTIQGFQFDPIRIPLGPSGLPLARWPLGLHHIKRLLVRALPFKEPRKRAGDPPCVYAAMFNHVLYSLSAFLAGDNSLTELWVDMRNAPVGDGERKHLTTYPLVMLGALDEITMTVERAEPTILRHCAVSDTPHAGDALTPALFALEEAEVWECLGLIANCHSPGPQSSPEYRASYDDWRRIVHVLYEMREVVDTLYQVFDADWEASVRGWTTPLQVFMDTLDVTGLLGEKVDGFRDLLDSIGEWKPARTMYGREVEPRLADAKGALEAVGYSLWYHDPQEKAKVEAFFKRWFAIMEDFPFRGEYDSLNVGVLDESSFSESSDAEESLK